VVLGVENLVLFNQALLGNGYGVWKEALWRSVMVVKYDSMWEGWCSKEVVGYGKPIGGGGGVSLDLSNMAMGDGSKFRCWHDLWCGDKTLKAAFLELFSITRCKEALVADYLQFSDDVQISLGLGGGLQQFSFSSFLEFMDLCYSST
jgi:hypothetical protein